MRSSMLLVDSVHITVVGKKKWVLSWPFLVWDKPILPKFHSNPSDFLQLCACNNILQDGALRLAALALGSTPAEA